MTTIRQPHRLRSGHVDHNRRECPGERRPKNGDQVHGRIHQRDAVTRSRPLSTSACMPFGRLMDGP